MLLEYLIDELEKCGVVILWLEVCVLNVVVIVLYESLGFNEVMICCNYYFIMDGCEDVIIMVLLISM